MERIKVGEIEEYDVLYIPEKDMIFCKNTAVSYEKMRIALILRKTDRSIIKADLTAFIDNDSVQLGCLNTTISNVEKINKEIKKIKRHGKKFNDSKNS